MTDSEFKLIDKRFDTIEKLCNGINTRLDTLNGKVYKHEEVINEAIGERKSNREAQAKVSDKVEELETRVSLTEKAELQHIINCPVSPKLRNIEDKLLSQTAIRKYMWTMFVGGMTLASVTIALLKLILG